MKPISRSPTSAAQTGPLAADGPGRDRCIACFVPGRRLDRRLARALRSQAEAAAQSGDWSAALKSLPGVQSTSAATALTHLGEAKAALALGRAFQGEQSLRRSIAADPGNPEPWQLLLQILRVEDRTLDASEHRLGRLREVGSRGTSGGPAGADARPARRAAGRGRPEERFAAGSTPIQTTSMREIALVQRVAAQPRAGDPDRAALLAELESIVANHPDHITAREVLVTALADAGEPRARSRRAR